MRILHVTDLHFRTPWFDWLAKESRRYDAVCLTGDLMDMFCGPPMRLTLTEQAAWLCHWIQQARGPLFVCTGNHDVAERDGQWLVEARRAGVVFVDNDEAVLNGYVFSCTPWAAKCRPRSTFGSADAGTLPSIVLCHAPPDNTDVSSNNGSEAGDLSVSLAAHELPAGSMILSGHAHSPKSWYSKVGGTWCFNPGCDFEAAVPNHVIIDTEKKMAWRIAENARGPTKLTL